MKHFDLDYYNKILWTDGYKALKEKAYEEPYNIFTIQQVTPLHVEDIREFWEWLQHAQLHNEYFPIEFLREVKDEIHWEIMPNELEFTFEEMKEFKDKINWTAVIYRQILTEQELPKCKFCGKQLPFTLNPLSKIEFIISSDSPLLPVPCPKISNPFSDNSGFSSSNVIYSLFSAMYNHPIL